MNKKEKFTDFVASVLAENPEWFGDTVYAMQYGLSHALSVERERSSDLASGLVFMVDWEQKKNKKFPYYHSIQRALRALWYHFGTAPIWKSIEPLIEDEKETE